MIRYKREIKKFNIFCNGSTETNYFAAYVHHRFMLNDLSVDNNNNNNKKQKEQNMKKKQITIYYNYFHCQC